MLPLRTVLLACVVIAIILATFESVRQTINSAKSSTSPVIVEEADFQPKEARTLSAQELLLRPLAQNLTAVPKILHQSWSVSDLPLKFERWSRSCRVAHPDWEWVLWTDQDNLDLVRIYAPWFLPTYEALSDRMPVYRADAVRNLYMHVFGGVYADLDTECLQPSETLFEEYGQNKRQMFLGRMGTDDSQTVSLPNAWFASTPGHPFWVLPLEFIQHNIDTIDTAEGLSGPGAVYDLVNIYNEKYLGDEMDHHYAQSGWRNLFPQPVQSLSNSPEQILTVLPHWEIYPYSWMPVNSPDQPFCWTRAELFDEDVCKMLLRTSEMSSHTITYWSHSWGEDGEGHDSKGLKSVSEQET